MSRATLPIAATCSGRSAKGRKRVVSSGTTDEKVTAQNTADQRRCIDRSLVAVTVPVVAVVAVAAVAMATRLEIFAREVVALGASATDLHGREERERGKDQH